MKVTQFIMHRINIYTVSMYMFTGSRFQIKMNSKMFYFSGGPAYSDHGVLHVILGIVITLVLLVFILVCVLHRRRKARKKKNKQEIEVRYVTRGVIGAPNRADARDGPRTDHLLMKERTEKVSIV